MTSKSDNAENGGAPATPKAGAGAAGGGYATLTTREQEILSKAMTCLKTAPEIDFPKLAIELSMSNPRSAVNAWAQIKKKMDWTMKGPDTPAGGKTPGTGKGKRKMAVVNEEEAGDDEDAGGPAKRAKVAPKPRKKAPATPKKGKAAADSKSPDVVKAESEEDKVGAEDQGDVNADVNADVKEDVKEDNIDGEV